MSGKRKIPLKNNQYYHVFNRSIAKFVIFNDASEFERMFQLLNLYRFSNFNYKYSDYNDLDLSTQNAVVDELKSNYNVLVEIIAYCLMPTHIHLILRQILDKGITKYIGRVLNGYSKYFNAKHKRSGPLWTSRFKSVLISGDVQLLHLSRYIHLNPTSAGLAARPEDWKFSSYGEYVNRLDDNLGICRFDDIMEKNSKEYKKFVEDRKSYQRELSIIKSFLIDNYSG